MEHEDKLRQLLGSTDEKSVAVAMEIIKGQNTFEHYLADYHALKIHFFGSQHTSLEAKDVAFFNQPEIERYGSLVTLTPTIKRLQHLQSLTLYMNQISNLPAELGQLEQLEKLQLNFNEIDKLPPEIGNLAQLKILWLHDNHLITLPKEIGKLTQLQELDLSSNRLSSLPKEIGKLTQLKELSLAGNQLTNLPPSICVLSSLQKLDLSRNPLPKALVQQISAALPNCEVSFEQSNGI